MTCIAFCLPVCMEPIQLDLTNNFYQWLLFTWWAALECHYFLLIKHKINFHLTDSYGYGKRNNAAKSLQSCLTLCDPRDCSSSGFYVHGILQARTLEWVVISFSNAWKWKVKVKSLSRVWLLATPCTAAYQASPSMDFSGKSTGVGCHCLLPKETILPLKKGTPPNILA